MFRRKAICWKLLALAACITGTTVAGSPSTATAQEVMDVVPNRYIVVFKSGMVGQAADRTAAALAADIQNDIGGTIIHTYQYALEGMACDLTPEELAAMMADERVDYVQPDYIGQAIATQPNPPSWGLDRIDQRFLPLDDVYAYPDSAGAGTHVYVLDTGMDLDHPEFTGRVVPGYDYDENDPIPDDCNGHGTHVAGTAAGTTYGVAKEATVHPIRVCDCFGFCTTSGTVAAIDDLTASHETPAVANMSLRWYGGNMAIDTAVANSVNAGITYAVAAGNDDENACNHSPARVPEAITVAATDDTDTRGRDPITGDFFSNFGPCVDLFAPGVEILSAYLDGGSAVFNGTSMASPHVAGAALLLLGEDASLTPEQVTQIILENATPNVVIEAGPGSPNLLLFVGAPPVSGDLRVQYKTYAPQPLAQHPSVNLRIYNDGDTAVDLADVEVEYYYVYEGMGQSEIVNIYWAGRLPSGTNITPFIDANIQQMGAERIIIYSFDSGAGTLDPGEYVELQSRFNKSDWSTYYQPNDYSFSPITAFQDWMNVTAYLDGTLVWGNEP